MSWAVHVASDQQLQRAQAQYRKARAWSLTSDKIARDHYRAARVPEKQIAPRLTAEQIDQLKQYAETLPLLSPARKQFRDAARMAERDLQQTEPARVPGPAHPSSSSKSFPGAAEQLPSEIISNTSGPTGPHPQLPETHSNDHQKRVESPATEAQQTNIK
jgi:hypothetical protein